MLKFKPKAQALQIKSDADMTKLADVATVEPPKLTLLSPFAELVDEVGALQEAAAPILEQIAALQAKLVPLNEKKAELQKVVDDWQATADEPVRLNGVMFRADAGKKGTSRSIKDMALVKKFMGADTFMQIATVKLGDIDKYLTGPQRDQVLETARTGRTLKVARKP